MWAVQRTRAAKPVCCALLQQHTELIGANSESSGHEDCREGKSDAASVPQSSLSVALTGVGKLFKSGQRHHQRK